MIKKYYISSTNIPKYKSNIACIGNFDASHRGHQALYKKTISLAKKYKKKAYLITFKDDPNTLLFNEEPIYSLKTRINLYESFGFDGVIIIKTNKKFYNVSAKDFVEKYLIKLNIDQLVVGYDFRFGNKQKGNVKLLKQYFNNVVVINAVKYKGRKISTQRIKKCINDGKYSEANRMLGYELKK